MTQEEMLANLKRIYPASQVAIRLHQEDLEILLRISRNDPFDDCLDVFHPYRIVNPSENSIVSAGTAEEALAALRDIGLSKETLEYSLDDSTIDMLMIMDAKNEMITEAYDPATIARAKTKHAAIDAQYQAAKDDPEKFKEFLIKLSTGEDMQPALALVTDEGESNNADI